MYNDAPLNLLRTSCRKTAKSECRDVAVRQGGTSGAKGSSGRGFKQTIFFLHLTPRTLESSNPILCFALIGSNIPYNLRIIPIESSYQPPA